MPHSVAQVNSENGPSLSLTITGWFHQVKHLAQQIMEWQGLNAHGFHPFALLLVEVLQLVHGQHAIPIHVHAAEPILNARRQEHSSAMAGKSLLFIHSYCPCFFLK